MKKIFNYGDLTKQIDGEIGVVTSFKFKEGSNKLRIVSESIPLRGEYAGNPTLKFVTRIIDRVDGQVKIAFFPYTVIKMLKGLQENIEYAFTEIPMPYDIDINAKNAGKKEVDYTIVPSRNNIELTAEEVVLVEKEKPLEDIVEKLKAKVELEKPKEEIPF